MKFSLLLLSSLLTLSCIIHAEEAASLPELPEVNNAPATENTMPEASRDLPDMPSSQPAATPQLTPEQIEKAKKEKNWLLEGLKEKEVKAEAKRQEEAMGRKTLVDEILERSQNQVAGLQTTTKGISTTENKADTSIKPALSTTAWEPLPEIDPNSNAAATGNQGTNSQDSKNNSFDETTGISNVFFDSKTGTFVSNPTNTSSVPGSNLPNMQQPWQQTQASVNTADAPLPEEKKVLDFEAKLLAQAKAQNKLPENYTGAALTSNESSPYLLANNSTSTAVNSNMTSPNFSTNQATFQAQPANSTSVAKLQMLEEERQRKLKDDNRPKALDIHSTFQGRGIEINPRFN